MSQIVIIGSGLAGYGIARELRKLDKVVPLRIVTADGGAFYPKPQISTAFAKGKLPGQLVTSDAETMALQQNIEISTRTKVHHIDRPRQVLLTSSGEIPYSKLVLALGADPIRLPLAGDSSDMVVSVNNLDDYELFRSLNSDGGVLILGGGLIGCEFANDLASVGQKVAVVEAADWPLASMAPRPVGELVSAALAELGVSWLLGRKAVAVDRSSSGYIVSMDDGSAVKAGLVLSAVGLRPHVALGEDAGLVTRRGIVVDSTGTTSDPDIFAIGDCAEYPSGTHLYVTPIMAAARAMARSVLGEPTEMAFPVLSVMVKTTAHPVVLAPPANAAHGEWGEAEGDANGVVVRFHGPDGRLTGYVLTGDKCTRRSELDSLIVAAREARADE